MCLCYLYLFQLKRLLRNVLDPYALTLQSAQLVRLRNYNNKIQCYDLTHPPNAPDWSFIKQDQIVYDIDIEGEFNFIKKNFENCLYNILIYL